MPDTEKTRQERLKELKENSIAFDEYDWFWELEAQENDAGGCFGLDVFDYRMRASGNTLTEQLEEDAKKELDGVDLWAENMTVFIELRRQATETKGETEIRHIAERLEKNEPLKPEQLDFIKKAFKRITQGEKIEKALEAGNRRGAPNNPDRRKIGFHYWINRHLRHLSSKMAIKATLEYLKIPMTASGVLSNYTAWRRSFEYLMFSWNDEPEEQLESRLEFYKQHCQTCPFRKAPAKQACDYCPAGIYIEPINSLLEFKHQNKPAISPRKRKILNK
jgi:hypothetical protein